jgi:hypothetical protein
MRNPEARRAISGIAGEASDTDQDAEEEGQGIVSTST